MNYKVNWWYKIRGYMIIEANSSQKAKRKAQRELKNGLSFNHEEISTDYQVTSVKPTKELL